MLPSAAALSSASDDGGGTGGGGGISTQRRGTDAGLIMVSASVTNKSDQSQRDYHEQDLNESKQTINAKPSQQQQQQQQQLRLRSRANSFSPVPPSGPPPSVTRPRMAFAAGIPVAELDLAVTGSTDLSGEKKEKIEHHRIEESSMLQVKYDVGRKLGQGSFGTVMLVTDIQTGQTFACKSLKKKKGSRASYEQQQREVAIMKLARHKYITQLREVFETPKKFFLVMEFCAGGELIERFRGPKPVSEAETRLVIRRIAEVVGYLHDHGVVHRDIKPENILLSGNPADPYDIRLSDFGLATWVNKCTMMEHVVGTPLYMAPEILQDLPYSAQCDIWSIGVMMYLFLSGCKKENEKALLTMVGAGKIEYPAQVWKSISPGAKNLCDSMLRVDPAKRISAREILLHPWIQNGVGDCIPLPLNANVLDLMKSFNTHRRMRRVLHVVLAAVRFYSGSRSPMVHPNGTRSELKVRSKALKSTTISPQPQQPATSDQSQVSRAANLSVSISNDNPDASLLFLESTTRTKSVGPVSAGQGAADTGSTLGGITVDSVSSLKSLGRRGSNMNVKDDMTPSPPQRWNGAKAVNSGSSNNAGMDRKYGNSPSGIKRGPSLKGQSVTELVGIPNSLGNNKVLPPVGGSGSGAGGGGVATRGGKIPLKASDSVNTKHEGMNFLAMSDAAAAQLTSTGHGAGGQAETLTGAYKFE